MVSAEEDDRPYRKQKYAVWGNSRFFDSEQGVPQGFTFAPNAAPDAYKRKNVERRRSSWECCLRTILLGLYDTPGGLQTQIDAAHDFDDTWRLSATVKKCAIMICNEDTSR